MFVFFLLWCVFKVLLAMATIIVFEGFIVAIPHRIMLCIVVIVGLAVDMVMSVENFHDKH